MIAAVSVGWVSGTRAAATVLPSHRRTPVVALAGLTASALIAARWAGEPWLNEFGFIPVALTVGVLGHAITAVLFAQQFLVEARIALLAAMTVFTWSALSLLTVMLTFPGLLSAQGIDGPNDAHVWSWTLWHALFPLALGVLALTWHRWPALPLRGPRAIVAATVVALGFHGLVLLVLHLAPLPALLAGQRYTPIVTDMVHPVTVALALTGLVLTWVHRDDGITAWFPVAAAAAVAGIALAFVAGERYTIGWYLGRVYVAVGALVLLIAMLGRVMNLQRLTLSRSEALLTQAESDPLTGILNRRALHERLGTISPRRPTIALIDCDRFKEVNDSLGHAAGDEFLVALAGRLRGALRQGDHVVRWGGDEFLVIINDSPPTGTLALERIHREVTEHPVRTSRHLLDVRISVGVAHWTDGDSFDAVLARADAALYRSKSQGGNAVTADR